MPATPPPPAGRGAAGRGRDACRGGGGGGGAVPPARRRRACAGPAALLLALLAACTSPGPTAPDLDALQAPGFRRAAPATPADASEAGGSSAALALPAAAAFDARWLAGIDDARLRDLIERAQRANPDLRIALERVRAARAGAEASATRRWPQASITASASDARSGLPDAVKLLMPDTRALRGGLQLDWELDAFGAARAAEEAATLEAGAAAEAAEVARWLAVTELSETYIGWQGARLRLARLESLLEAQHETERLTRSRFGQGEASRFDLARAAGETQALAATLPPLRTQIAVAEHRMAVLVGQSPGRPLLALDGAAEPLLPELPPLAPGQPAELLWRRPDLRAAERQWRAAGARLREASADRWPRLFLSAVTGRQDLALGGVDLAPVRYGNVALAFALPVFDAGRRRAAVEHQSAREREATRQYERAVLRAIEDVENSLVQLGQERRRALAVEAALAERRSGLRHAESLYREGQIDLLQLIDAQRGVIAAELAGIDSATQRALGAVQLFKALGGSWQVGAAVPLASADSAPAPAPGPVPGAEAAATAGPVTPGVPR